MSINAKVYLSPDLFKATIAQAPTRDGYGAGVVAAGTKDKNVVVLCCDLVESTRSLGFAEKFPNRFFEVGVAEQNMAGMAAGLAFEGKIPFTSSYAVFSPGRNWDQTRVSICYSNANVKVMGGHTGISVGPDGATHQALEDMAIMRVLPNMRVVAPADAIETRKAVEAAAQSPGPIYIRFAREKTPVFTTERSPFAIGRAEVLWQGTDVVIIACGPLVYEALVAAKQLQQKKISVMVINSHTVKPLDAKTIVAAARKTKAVVTVEEHQITGGLGGAVAELLAREYPVPMVMVGMPDTFGESGEPAELLQKYGMTAVHIIKAVQHIIKRKL